LGQISGTVFGSPVLHKQLLVQGKGWPSTVGNEMAEMNKGSVNRSMSSDHSFPSAKTPIAIVMSGRVYGAKHAAVAKSSWHTAQCMPHLPHALCVLLLIADLMFHAVRGRGM
jgi:hypothetical protein